MRLVQVQVPAGAAERVLSLAAEHEAGWSAAVEGRNATSEPVSMVSLAVPNHRVGALIYRIWEEIDEARFIIDPYGVLPLRPPASEVQEKVRDVRRRSTLELVLSSLQSLGSKRAMLLYALLSGVVAAYAVVFDVVYLLVAAMLVAPMGAPALVAVVGAAVGDRRMFLRGGARFALSVAVLVVTAALFGLAIGAGQPSVLMEQISSISRWTVLLAVAAGAAGALSQLQSERASLVTGTATGFLVAAALSPTSAVLGLGLVLGRWDFAGIMGFQLAGQFVAIVAGGWLVLIAFGVRPEAASAGRGSARWSTIAAGSMIAAAALLMVLQAGLGPAYARADLARRAAEVVRTGLAEAGGLAMVSVETRFVRARPEARGGEVLLVTVVVENRSGEPDDSVAARAREVAAAAVRGAVPGVVPLVDVTVVAGPSFRASPQGVSRNLLDRP